MNKIIFDAFINCTSLYQALRSPNSWPLLDLTFRDSKAFNLSSTSPASGDCSKDMKVRRKQRGQTKEKGKGAAVGFHYSILLLYPCTVFILYSLGSSMLLQYQIF